MKKRAAATTAKSKPMAKGKLKRRGSFFASPTSIPSPDSSSKPYNLDLPSFPSAAASSSLNASADPFSRHHVSPPPSSKTKTTAVATISDLKSFAGSRIESLKQHFDVCHSEMVNEFDASNSRLSKRFKIQTKACLQLTEEAENDCKKIADRMNEHTEMMKASYAEVISKSHSTASHVCKVSIPELMQSMEKAIDRFRNRYKIPTTPM
ncbi:uncharacterized protein LOC122037286 [Zingiber officinale]|uniref:Uncharacterized protein n=1 Tax=Zingiber officinale TaxID=94328 RepID=A0A8J5HXI2_ZINOF|nr:uncharacterized protein LOC122037286 [Zingiber officinale]XP_042452679.1 uncharacterized protein LOC122037286 [Zingiber officinale]XP_042452685.1 uncharacterized protein LOC122037286 [Zingiber officinale]XP_042452687.1 uncharacterized protein LOC122037286 [Zingiber officinale]KAG6537772.1 hypothetical protein ZIOFF_002869 [Zingiber officinale]